MRLSNIAHLYVVRLKAKVVLVQELFAVLGLAVGVALLFASQVASASLNGSIAQLTSGVVGQAKYQLKARSSQGFDESLAGQVQRLPGVRAAVPVLEQNVILRGPHGSRSVDMVATDPRSVHLAGRLLRHFSTSQLAHSHVLGLPAPIAGDLGVEPLDSVTLQAGARVRRALVGIELGERSIGPLVNSPIVLAPLSYAQQLTGARGRITRIFVQTRPGQDRAVHAALVRLAAGRLNVAPAGFEATLFTEAAAPVNQSTRTFAAICALVGFMFAYCSMLLTTDLRRALVRELRRGGATRWETVKTLQFDALVLAGVASLLGLALGNLLSLAVFNSPPSFLSFAFPIGSQRTITWESVAIAVGAGTLAACVGVMTPMADVWRHASRDHPRRTPSAIDWPVVAMLGGGCALLAATTVILIAAPQSAVVGIGALIAALLLLMPILLDGIVAGFERVQRPFGFGSTALAVIELRSPLTRTRSIAIAATAAVAVFGSIVMQGTRANLERGLDRLVGQLSAVSDVWVIPSGNQNLLATTSFEGVPASTFAHLPGISTVGSYRAAFLEYGNRRVWVLAPPPTATSSPLPPSQLVAGDLHTADARLRAGGWAVISRTLATAHHLRIGQTFTLPSPRPMTLRVAALTTNLGWPPGAILLNGEDYVRGWESPDPSAYNVIVSPGASPAAVGREIKNALGPGSALAVETAAQRERRQQTAGHQGLDRLTQIALLVLLGGVLATGTVMAATIWQRRRRFARMKVQGYGRGVLWQALIWQSALLIGSGCLVGAAFGVYGQVLLSHAILTVTGIPAAISANILIAFANFVVVTVVAAGLVAINGYRAAGVAPYPWLNA